MNGEEFWFKMDLILKEKKMSLTDRRKKIFEKKPLIRHGKRRSDTRSLIMFGKFLVKVSSTPLTGLALKKMSPPVKEETKQKGGYGVLNQRRNNRDIFIYGCDGFFFCCPIFNRNKS